MNDIEEKIREGYKLFLYGSRKFGKIAFDNLKIKGINVDGFIDDNINAQHTLCCGVKVFSLEEVKETNKKYIIIIGNYYLNSVLEQLMKYAIDMNNVFFNEELLIDDLDNVKIKAHKKDIEIVYHQLSDYKSKWIYRTLFYARIEKRTADLAILKEEIQYFPTDIFKYQDKEVIIDGGGYIGDTVQSMENVLHSMGKTLQYAYIFEPDNINYKHLITNNNIKTDKKVYNAGLYSSDMVLSFTSGQGGSSMVEDQGEECIEVKTIDHIVNDQYPPTIIKMDIEGCEYEALKGAQETIKKYKPKLAICIYHKQEDLWELPTFIKKLVPEYNLYIRNYTGWLDEVVLYATL